MLLLLMLLRLLLLRHAATGNSRVDYQRGLQIPQILRIGEIFFKFGLKKRSIDN